MTLLRKLPFMQSKTPFPAAGTHSAADTTRLADLRCLKASQLTASHSPSPSEKGMVEQNDRIWVSAGRDLKPSHFTPSSMDRHTFH